jgi:hypothetical protein
MSTLQHDELLTQSEILEKETLPPEKEADQHAEAAPDEAYNKTAVSWQQLCYRFHGRLEFWRTTGHFLLRPPGLQECRLFDPHLVVVEKIEADAPFLAPFAFEYAHYGKTTFRVVIRAWELVPGVFGRVRF